MSLRSGTLKRYFPFVFALVFTAVFITPYCGFLMHCGCRELWQGGTRLCNIHAATGPHCPFCAHGNAGFYLLSAPSIVAIQFLGLILMAKRRGALVMSAASVLLFFLAGAFVAWIEASHDHYSPPPLLAESRISCAASNGSAQVVLAHAHGSHFDHSGLHHLLARHVNDDGWVDYDGLRNERQLLARYLESVGNTDAGTLANPCEELAFWINAYNGFTLADVLDDVYGKAHSVREVAGFFDRKTHFIALQRLTLDQIEARGRALHDPRIHFALVCGSTSCPKLQKFAYTGAGLDAELDQAARAFLRDPSRGARIETKDRLLLSPILKWYSGDFSGQRSKLGNLYARVSATISNKTALDYISQYVDPEMKRWIEEKRPSVRYFDYDWSLNAQATHKDRTGVSR